MLRSLLITLALLFVGCAGGLGSKAPEDPTKEAKAAAGQAFQELESGEQVPLPGVTPEPDAGEGDISELAKAAADFTDYTVQPGWFMVDTTITFANSVAPDQARNQTLNAARAGGLEKSIPPEISFSSLLTDIMAEEAGAAMEQSTWSTFAFSTVSGYIIDETILASELLTGAKPGAYDYRVVLEARVEPVKGERNPALRLEVDVAERYLKDGDELVVKVRSTRAGYLYIFDFLSDNSVLLMYPNAMLEAAAIPGGEWLEIPTDQERARGIHFRVAADPDVITTTESIYAVFTLNPIARLDDLIKIQRDYVQFSAGDASFTNFQRWLAEIPLGQRTEKAVRIHIVNDKE
ncbi:DUF4384 domain-containing protein [Candidatus Neomarinimicrobiota bacterium]